MPPSTYIQYNSFVDLFQMQHLSRDVANENAVKATASICSQG